MVFFLRKKLGERFGLADSELESEQATRSKMRPRLFDQCADQFVAFRAGEESDLRIVQDFGRKKMSILRGNVGQIRDDEVERSIDLREQVAFPELNPLAQPKPLSIFARQGQSII